MGSKNLLHISTLIRQKFRRVIEMLLTTAKFYKISSRRIEQTHALQISHITFLIYDEMFYYTEDY